MAESIPTSGGTLPLAPHTSAAPGTIINGNGNGNGHMQPLSLPPVVIPQNNNPIPTALGSAVFPGLPEDILSPPTPGGTVRRSAPEPNKRALYIGGLDQRVTEEILNQIFETAGHVISVKIIPDKNVSSNHTDYNPIARTVICQ